VLRVASRISLVAASGGAVTRAPHSETAPERRTPWRSYLKCPPARLEPNWRPSPSRALRQGARRLT
jgi:hypothetical protein